MSRIGKLPISIPQQVKVSIDDQLVTIEGPKGKLSRRFDKAVRFNLDAAELRVEPATDSRHSRAMYGTSRSILQNMVDGVINGYSKSLEIHGVGFRATLKGDILDLALGYSHPIHYPVPSGITVTITDNTKLKVEGADKQVVGQVAADIKHYYPVEPYKGKGVRIVGEFIRRKEGKKTA